MVNVPATYADSVELSDAYKRGWTHGNGFACHNVPKIGTEYFTDSMGRVEADSENIREIHSDLCFAAESNSRQYSPFEFTAHEFNSSDNAESLWEAFDAGIADSINHDLETYTDSDYGIEEN